MGKSLFQKRIFCSHCQKGMKFKRERSIGKYICSSYDTLGTCQRIIVREDELVELLRRRFKTDDIQSHIQKVERVEVEDSKEIVIRIINDDPIVVSYSNRIYKY